MVDFRSKEKLKKDVKHEVTKLFEASLDYSQIACSSPETFTALRGKILRVGNDCIRKLHRIIDSDYEVVYTNVKEEIIKIQR